MKSTVSRVTWILVAFAAVWFARPATVQARGCGGGGRPRPRPTATGGVGGASGQTASERGDRVTPGANARVTIDWREFRLAKVAQAGYAETAAPLTDLIDREVKQAGATAPLFILIVDPEAEKLNAALSKCLGNDKIAIVLKRFVCLKASVETIPDEEAREEVRKNTPLVFTYDPAGKQTARLKSRRTGSRSALAAAVEKTFKQSFTLPLKKYTRTTLHIIEQLERIETERVRIYAKLETAKGAKQVQLERELTKLETHKERSLKAEKELMKECTLRPEFNAGNERASK